MNLGRFMQSITGKVKVRLSLEEAFLSPVAFQSFYSDTPLWDIPIDTIRATVINDFSCFTITLRKGESA